MLQAIGIRFDSELTTLDGGPALVELAKRRAAITSRLPLTGDLLIFDDGSLEGRQSLIAVVVTTHPRTLGGHLVHTVEFVYLGGNIVRRGFTTPRAPDVKRDDSGLVLNTFLCHRGGHDGGDKTRFMAGKLLHAIVRVEQLTAIEL